jgi:hypothetical protein
MADGVTTITINREKDYHAFEAEGTLKAGTAIESFEAKMAFDMNLSASLALTTALAGVKIEGKLIAITIKAEKGPKFEMFNGLSFFGRQAKAAAFLARADVLLIEAKSVLAEVDTGLMALESSVTSAKQSNVLVKTDVQAVM